MALAKKISSREFRDRYCEFGGIRLRFDGASGWKGLAACSQYIPDQGCSIHGGRPLVCRLFPLGRQRRGDSINYMHLGSKFPCLDGCPEVIDQPHLTVAEYIEDQKASVCETAQDAYIELMEELADGAFALLIESGLAATGDRMTLQLWRKLGNQTPEKLTSYLGQTWIDQLMLPEITGDMSDPVAFSRSHHDLLQQQSQKSFGTLNDAVAISEASGVMMGLALHLGRGLGISPKDLVTNWIETAKNLGALK